jgi:hypothetical protein
MMNRSTCIHENVKNQWDSPRIRQIKRAKAPLSSFNRGKPKRKKKNATLLKGYKKKCF